MCISSCSNNEMVYSNHETLQRGAFMIQYKIVHHVPGRIRIEVPSLKGLSMTELRRLSETTVPPGIAGMRANPILGTLVITYDPAQINIVAYVEEMASRTEFTVNHL
jgi:Heavy metal associated domain 2